MREPPDPRISRAVERFYMAVDRAVAALSPNRRYHNPYAPQLAVMLVETIEAMGAFLRGVGPRRVGKPPGHLLGWLTDFIFTRKTNARIFNQIIIDMREEYCEAMAKGRTIKARWICWRGRLSILLAVVLFVSGSVVKAVIQAFKIS